MKWKLIFILVTTVLSSKIFSECQDPLWLFADSQCKSYNLFSYQDTCMRGILEVDPYELKIDTGDSYDGSIYLNFNYQFQSDTFFIRDTYDTDLLRYKDFRPGFAGLWRCGPKEWALLTWHDINTSSLPIRGYTKSTKSMFDGGQYILLQIPPMGLPEPLVNSVSL